MHMWELLLDCWTDAAQPNTDSLRWIGIGDIVNADVRRLIRKEIRSQLSTDRPLGTGRVTILSDSMTWKRNYFIRAAERVAGALNKRIVSATLSITDIRGCSARASNGSEIDDIFLEMDMILELG